MRKRFWMAALVFVFIFTFHFGSAYATEDQGDFSVEDDPIAQFLKENPDRASLYVIRNGDKVIDYNSNRAMTLASTSKLVIALEYAKQAAKGKINPSKKVSLDDLALFYVPGSDGNAHEAWLKDIETRQVVQNGKVSLQEVAKGMIKFSSNANSEYLLMLLGINKVNDNLDDLNFNKHEKFFPSYASIIFVPYSIMSTLDPDLPFDERVDLVKTQLSNMSQKKFIAEADKIFKILQKDKTGRYKDQVVEELYPWYDSEINDLIVARLPKGTTKEYATLMNKINSRSYLSNKVQEELDAVIENPLKPDSPFTHVGLKGGSTAKVLTMSFYSTDKNGNKIELALFTNELTKAEFQQIAQHLSVFLLERVQDEDYLDDLKQYLQ
ncbi:D-alanyl-D-alanine carboxypeptidase [Brevibacillus reuszeri]|uniref:serine hydrolase n=1 Tax=Brevibacillus reuszeri TaxID=54915 RepID=UPI001B2772F7|nr:serine hydrolase [Brevibacillus reuszeri]GIO09907.1 D-alanyl-D-alanine carboxypeptidase [Brevibacillus reuszeri]